MTRQFFTTEQVIHIHDELVMSSAVPSASAMRAFWNRLFYAPEWGITTALPPKAAAIIESLFNNHPFVDGNKRTATAATEIFLNLNGYFIDYDDFAAYEFFMCVFDEGTVRFASLLPRLEEHIKSLP